jgi:hypothetical protein
MKTPLAPLHGRVFAERIWHSVKDEEVHIKVYANALDGHNRH